jgi:hypothetical protein
METASAIIEEAGDARSATKALKVLNEQIEKIKESAKERRSRQDQEDFTYTYQEEADPEVFFVPYVWEVAVCCVTSSDIEWMKDNIRIFPLLEDEPPPLQSSDSVSTSTDNEPQEYSKDVSEVV